MLKILFSAIAGLALMATLFGIPPQLKNLWNEAPEIKTTNEFEERALKIVNNFEATYKAQADCKNPNTELKRLECKNRKDMAFQSFVRLHMKTK